MLPLEFVRVSRARSDALTLVIDETHGAPVEVSVAQSRHRSWTEAAAELAARENTVPDEIGVATADGTVRGKGREAVAEWLAEQGYDAAVWTGLPNNFAEAGRPPFSIPAALAHLRQLSAAGQTNAAAYFARAPEFVRTPLRAEVETENWMRAAIPRPR